MARFRLLRSRRALLIGVALLAVVLFVLPSSLVKLLWMQALGYASVFWTLLLTKTGLFVAALAVVVLYFGVNFYAMLRQAPVRYVLNEGTPWGQQEQPQLSDVIASERSFVLLATVLTGLFGLMFASTFAANWNDFLRFWHAQPYGSTDPVFGKDLSLYLLQLPFINSIQGSLVALFFLGLLVLGAVYVLLGQLRIERGRGLQVPPAVVRHLAVNLMLLLAAWAWGYYLNRYELLYTPGGVVFGASYVDVNIQIPVLWALLFITLALIGLLAINLRGARPRLLLAGVGLYAVLAVIGQLIPGLVQQFQVEPNELDLETPYLANNIRLTRQSYQLDAVQAQSYPAEEDLTLAEVQGNRETLRNIRLWDPRLLISTYRQIQEIRLYYQFYDVDVDRYMVDGDYRQVMLSARELAQELPERASTWFNRHLQYTHGYGLTMNPVARSGQEGTPRLLIQDIPPVSTASGLDVEQPAIYYGERTPTYRIVPSNAQELDYPQGDDNAYTHYDGTGGVPIGSFWRQLLFAWNTSDLNLVLSDYLAPNSRIQFWNRLQQRIRKVAPFLQLDQDPYLVLSEGRLVWVQDAYTTARTFPYAEPAGRGRFNYIRNSVKIAVDAYDGSVTFYVMDPDDPVLGTYRSAFPELFKPLSAMSDALRDHLRYPQDIFEVQVQKYNRYHMTNPQVFYNNEDLWTQPRELYRGQRTRMEPYYILTRLPGQDRLQFVLMTPVTPENRDNMIGWVAAKSDFPNYGELVAYELPKEKLIYGPAQIEAKIDQDTDISRQLTLWDQQGSRVERGNLIVVPLEDSFLYVEPVFLIAEEAEIPQLKRVIVTHGERVSMQPTLDQALQVIFGGDFGPEQGAPQPLPAAAPGAPASPAELEEARQAFQRAEQALQQGDFTTFGSAFDDLRSLLSEEGVNQTSSSDTARTGTAPPPAPPSPQE